MIIYKSLKNRLLVILNSGNTTYSLNLLLSVFRHCEFNENDTISQSKVLDFIITYERYLLYLLLGPSKRFSSKPIYDAIKALNTNRFDDAKNEFKLEDSEIEDLKDLISKPIKDNTIAKLFIAKYFWIIDCETEDDVLDNVRLNFENSTLEHIIPQNPEDNTNWLTDFDDSFRKKMTYRLGNMTLLTKKKNSSAKNYGFDKKKLQYQKTKLPLTSSIANENVLTDNYFNNRHKEIVIKLLTDLNIDTHNIQ